MSETPLIVAEVKVPLTHSSSLSVAHDWSVAGTSKASWKL